MPQAMLWLTGVLLCAAATATPHEVITVGTGHGIFNAFTSTPQSSLALNLHVARVETCVERDVFIHNMVEMILHECTVVHGYCKSNCKSNYVNLFHILVLLVLKLNCPPNYN